MDEEAQLKEMARLERAIQREGVVKDKSPPKRVVYDDEQLKEFSKSEKDLINKASESFIEDNSDDEIIDEEIFFLPVTPAVAHRNSEFLAKEEAELKARVEEKKRELKRLEEEVARAKNDEKSDETKLAKALETTKLNREQEQRVIQAQLRREKEKLTAERNFANEALRVAEQAAKAPKKSAPSRVCARCDAQTGMEPKCEHCGFLGSLFGGLSF